MSAGHAFRQGLARLRHAPFLVCGLWLLTVLVAVPLAVILNGMLAHHLSGSLAAESAAEAVNYDWWNEFLAQASGIGDTWVPAIIGFAAVLKNGADLADGRFPAAAVAPAVGAYLLLSTFLLGGVLDRLARGRATRAYGFFSACGVYFFRFLRLAVIAGIVYGFLFTEVHAWIFETWYEAWTRDVTVERIAFAYRAAGYLLFALLVAAVNLAFDYAKIRAVVEDRRSMLGALAAAVRFLTRYPGPAIRLYLLNTLVFLVVVLLYFVLAVEPTPGASMLLALAVGQLYIVLRVVVRLQFAASQIALFQGALAHAGYTAAPDASWPDSPAVESLRSAV